MIRPKIPGPLYAPAVLLAGLAIAQAIATLQVYLSNARLYAVMQAVMASGYLAVPNRHIIPGLLHFSPAFYGGLFFTFTLGAGLSLFYLAAAWFWDRLLQRRRFFLAILSLAWAATLILVNAVGITPVASLYFVFIPPVVFTLAVKWLPGPAEKADRGRRAVQFSAPFLLAILWFSQADSMLFADLRDNLLLSNPIGRQLNNFYYTYTLYPAEAFKSLDQKTIKTCRLENIHNKTLFGRLREKLCDHDYLPVAGPTAPDVKITLQKGRLVFADRGRAVLKTTLQDFLGHAGSTLRKVAARSDRHAALRRLTFLSLLAGFPVAVYLLAYAVICLCGGLFVPLRTSALIASLLCLLAGLLLLGPLYFNRSSHIAVKDPERALTAADWQTRVAALKIMEKRGQDINDFRILSELAGSPQIAERYWLARVLASSRRPAALSILLHLADDPQVNVRCMAFYALGRRGNAGAIPLLLQKIKTSDSWYDQLYAYRALRALGWKQKKSN